MAVTPFLNNAATVLVMAPPNSSSDFRSERNTDFGVVRELIRKRTETPVVSGAVITGPGRRSAVSPYSWWMGEVVRLEKPSQKDRKTAGKPKRRRPRRSRTALVLGGGGFTGGVYEIGALRALDLLAVNRTVNQFDVYVGTSAGSFVASLTANGVTPEEMMRVVNQQVPTPFRDIDLGTLLQPNYLDFARSLALLPLRSVGVLRRTAAACRLGNRRYVGFAPCSARIASASRPFSPPLNMLTFL